MRYKYVFFDLDGTLLASKRGIKNAVDYAIQKTGYSFEYDEGCSAFIGPPIERALCELSGSERRGDELYAAFREYYDATGAFESSLFPGIERMLQKLGESGAHCCVATCKHESAAHAVLRHYGVDRYFLSVAGVVPGRTEKAEVIAHLLSSLGVAPAQAVMVGDRSFDLLGALQTGLSAIGVSYGYAAPGELEALRPEAILPSADALLAYLLEDAC